MLMFHTHCVANITHDWTDPDFILSRDQVFRVYHGYLAIPPTIAGFALTLLYMAAVMRAITDRRVSRKFYALLLNRAFGDLLACVASFTIILYVLGVEHIDNNVIQVINTLFTGCYWTAMVSYVSLGLLKLYGIARPLHYREKATMARVKRLIWISWLTFTILVTITMGVTALEKVPSLSAWSGCTFEHCAIWMYRARNALTVVLYLITVGCFLVTVALIRRAQHAVALLHRRRPPTVRAAKRRFRYPLIKLALNVATFATFNAPYSAWMLFWVFAPGCFFFQHVFVTFKLVGIVRISLLVRIIVDGVLGFAVDKEIRNSLFALLCPRNSSIHPSGSTFFVKYQAQSGDEIEISSSSVSLSLELGGDSRRGVLEATTSVPTNFSVVTFEDEDEKLQPSEKIHE